MAIAITLSIVGSLLFAAVIAFFRYNGDMEPYELPYRLRVFQPDNTALVVFFVFTGVSSVLALTEMSGVGSAWVRGFQQILLIPVAIPFLVLAPLAIRFHWAVIGGLVLSVLWMSLLATVISDLIHERPLPLLRD